jgi:hypothetical protein
VVRADILIVRAGRYFSPPFEYYPKEGGETGSCVREFPVMGDSFSKIGSPSIGFPL